jgi:predicted lipid carrier protein YhbT
LFYRHVAIVGDTEAPLEIFDTCEFDGKMKWLRLFVAAEGDLNKGKGY